MRYTYIIYVKYNVEVVRFIFWLFTQNNTLITLPCYQSVVVFHNESVDFFLFKFRGELTSEEVHNPCLLPIYNNNMLGTK